MAIYVKVQYIWRNLVSILINFGANVVSQNSQNDRKNTAEILKSLNFNGILWNNSCGKYFLFEKNKRRKNGRKCDREVRLNLPNARNDASKISRKRCRVGEAKPWISQIVPRHTSHVHALSKRQIFIDTSTVRESFLSWSAFNVNVFNIHSKISHAVMKHNSISLSTEIDNTLISQWPFLSNFT